MVNKVNADQEVTSSEWRFTYLFKSYLGVLYHFLSFATSRVFSWMQQDRRVSFSPWSKSLQNCCLTIKKLSLSLPLVARILPRPPCGLLDEWFVNCSHQVSLQGAFAMVQTTVLTDNCICWCIAFILWSLAKSKEKREAKATCGGAEALLWNRLLGRGSEGKYTTEWKTVGLG